MTKKETQEAWDNIKDTARPIIDRTQVRGIQEDLRNICIALMDLRERMDR